MLELTEVAVSDSVTPKLEYGECDKTNRRDLDTGGDSVGVSGVRWFVEMVVVEVASWMKIITIVEVASFGVMIPIEQFVRPGHVEATCIRMYTS